jgi:hypothetical protein
MVLEQIVYQTNAYPHACIERLRELNMEYRESETGLLTFRISSPSATVQLSPRGKLSTYVDSSTSNRLREKLWRTLKKILRTAEGKELDFMDIRWLKRVPYPGTSNHEVRLKALMYDGWANGSIESQLSVLDELRAMEKKKLGKKAHGRHVRDPSMKDR